MITFITGNKHKVIEAENIFKDYDINLEHIDLGYCEPQGTLEEVAISGAKYASRKLNKPLIFGALFIHKSFKRFSWNIFFLCSRNSWKSRNIKAFRWCQ